MNKTNNPSIPVWGRILLIVIAYILIAGIFSVIGELIFRIPITTLEKDMNPSQLLIVLAFNLAGTFLTIFIFRKYIDKKTFISMGLHIKNKWADMFLGFLVAFGIMAFGTLFLYLTGYIQISLFSRFEPLTLLYSVLLFLIISFSEELFTRGYILNNLLESGNKYLALIISSAIFAAFHLLNPNLSFLGVTNVFLSGILLGSAYIFTKNLWFPISLHFFWNFFQGPVLGYQVSGKSITSFSSIVLNSKNIINGGDFGFEGSVVCTFLLILSIALVILFYKKTSRLKTNGKN